MGQHSPRHQYPFTAAQFFPTSLFLSSYFHSYHSQRHPRRQEDNDYLPDNQYHDRSSSLGPLANMPDKAYRCPHCHSTSQTFKDPSALDSHIRRAHTRPFKCVFHFAGCQSTFASKNEWKRHQTTQHLVLHYWLCTEGPCGKPLVQNVGDLNSGSSGVKSTGSSGIRNSVPGAIFNRRDLFTQHVRRMHMPPTIKKDLKLLEQQKASGHKPAKHSPLELTRSAWDQQLRAKQSNAMRDRVTLPTYMRCPAESCLAEFKGEDAWDQRMEHVARHLESGDRGEIIFGGKNDKTLMEWVSRPDVNIIQPHNGGWAFSKSSRRWNLGHETEPTQHGHPADSGYGSMQADRLVQSLDIGRNARSPKVVQLSTIPSFDPVQMNEGMEDPTYSTASTFESNARRMYVSEFAEDLNSAFPANLTLEEWETLSPFLGDILQEFATRIAYEEPDNKVCRNIMYLVHSYHDQIIACLGHKFEDGDEHPTRQIPPGGMSVEEKIIRWKVNENAEDNTDDPKHMRLQDSTECTIDLPDDDEIRFADAVQYREVLNESPAYEWLVSRVHRQHSMEITGDDHVASAIKGLVLETLGRPKHISRHAELPVYKAVFDVDWHPLKFLRSQEWEAALGDILPSVMTLTGEPLNAQATSCMEYLTQMWPETGFMILELLGDILLNPSAVLDRTLPDDTLLSVFMTEHSFHMTMTGSSYCVSELATQLAWLAGALRASTTESLASCTPWLEVLPERRDSDAHFGLHFKVEPLEQSLGVNGACWTNMFWNPVIVKGYPIPRRAKSQTGLEMSLDSMATMTNAKRLVEFCGKTIIKGFSTMLVASAVVEDIVFWHHFFNPDGRFISYSDKAMSQSGTHCNVSFDVVEKSRHIVGWCEEVRCFAGAADANYDIEASGLPKPHSRCAFTNVSISAGKFLTIGTTCVPLIKDKPTRISYGDDYLGMLSTLDDRHFVMCDAEDRRSWLISGASAVLHILRASIRHTKNDPRFRDHFVFPDEELVEAQDPYGGSLAAFHVLSNFHNLELPLYAKPRRTQEEETRKLGSHPKVSLKTTRSSVCLKDRVDDICHNLSMMIAHQENMDSESGVAFRLKSTPRRQLEGFEFRDLATGRGTLWPKVHTLHHWGSGWVDFTRAIHAVTLFGRGFGELLQPSEMERPCGACHWHKCLPHGKDYLATSTYELSKIIASFGNRDSRDSRAWRIVDNIHWYTPDKAFEACQCSSTHRRLHDRIQVFIPPKLVKRVLKTTTPPPKKLPQNGAIILGHSKKYPIRWPAQGDPDEGQPEDDDGQGEIITDLNDSGIGTSAGSSSLLPLRGSTTPTSDENRKLYTHGNDQFIRQEEEEGTQAGRHHGNSSSAQSDWRRMQTEYADERAQIRKGKRKASNLGGCTQR